MLDCYIKLYICIQKRSSVKFYLSDSDRLNKLVIVSINSFMKKYRNLIFYASTIGAFSIFIYFILISGENKLSETGVGQDLSNHMSSWETFIHSLNESIAYPLAILLLQIVVILFAVRIFGWICQKLGQPTVIGEIIAGIVLGPSLLGLYFPEISAGLFPITSLSNIQFLSQIGLILFMFIVGMELDIKALKNKAQDAVLISHASIIFPFALGILFAYFTYDEFTHDHTDFISFALFMGIAMSITAFPVLARIVHERGINKTALGPIIITCAAIDDITAWCILAAVIAVVKAGSFTSSIFTLITAIIYVIAMFKIVRPILKSIADSQASRKSVSKSMMGIFFIVLFLSAYATEVIGIHALFGAFLAGVIMPPNMSFRNLVTEKIEDVSLTLLLPLFFVYTGLRTEIGLLNSPHLWLVCFFIIIVAITGKFWGSALAARFVKTNWKDSLTIGVLMNTRGLMELVVLNIGLDLGILTPEIFAMMVVMALATTFMTSPLLSLIDRIFKNKITEEDSLKQKKYKILVSFENSDMGRKLLFIANCFIRKRKSHSELTMLHISEGDMLYQHNEDEDENEIFRPVIDEANSLQQTIVPVYKIASNTHANVAKMANKDDYDFLLIGHKGSIFSRNVFGRVLGFSNKLINMPQYIISKLSNQKKWRNTILAPVIDEGTRAIISKSDMPVGIFIDKGLIGIRNVFVPIVDEDDIFIGEFMERLAENSYVRITLWDSIGLADKSIEFTKSVRAIKSVNPYLFQLWNNNIPIDSDILKKQDLMMISLNSWKKLDSKGIKWVKDAPSALILAD